jgi:hypothetical protein
MKMKKYLLSSGVMILCFGVGCVYYAQYEYLSTMFGPAPDVVVDTPAVSYTEPDAVVWMPEQTSVLADPGITSSDEPAVDDWWKDYFTGEYYLAEEKLPKGFRDLEYLELTTHVYVENSETPWQPVPAKGMLKMGRSYDLMRLSITRSFLTFETETIKGVSYRFSGTVAIPGDDVDEVRFKGKLMKLKNGRTTDTIDAEFLAVHGC